MKNIKKSIKEKYEYVGFLPGSVRIKENGYWGLNDYDGNEIIPSSYIEVFTLSSGYGLIAARSAGFWDIYDFSGNKINSQSYNFIYPYYGMFGMSKIKIGKFWGLLNKYGKVIIPAKYIKIEKFGRGLLLYKSKKDIEFIERTELIKLTEQHDKTFFIRRKDPMRKKVYNLTAKKIKSM